MKIIKVSIVLMISLILSFLALCNGSTDHPSVPMEYYSSGIFFNYTTTTTTTTTTIASNTGITTSTTNPITGTNLKVATYNVEALSSTESTAKYVAVEAALAQLDADILILEEIGDSTVLTKLKDELSASYSITYSYSRCATNGFMIYNGILSKYQITSSSELSGNTTDPCTGASSNFARGVNECLIRITGSFSVYVLGAHLKAMEDATSFEQRRAEAKAIEDRVSTLSLTYPNIIVAGDMNTVTTTGPSGSCSDTGDVGTTYTYLTITDDGTSSNDFVDSVLTQFPTSTPITYDNGSLTSRIDYIFVSPHAWTYYVANSCQVVTTGAAAHSGGLPSDHYPVILTLNVP